MSKEDCCEAYGGGYCEEEYVISVNGNLFCKSCASSHVQNLVEQKLNELHKAIRLQTKTLVELAL